jgi:hypothetical protein
MAVITSKYLNRCRLAIRQKKVGKFNWFSRQAEFQFSFFLLIIRISLAALAALLNAAKLVFSLTKSKTMLLNNFEHNSNVFHPK